MASSNKYDTKVLSEEEVKENLLNFKYFPEFASFIHDNFLDEYTQSQIRFSREDQLPFAKYFEKLDEAAFFELAKQSSINLLNAFMENKVDEYINTKVAEYAKNLMPGLNRENVLPKDISTYSLIRRKSFRQFLHLYTSDIKLFAALMEELDMFIAKSESAYFTAFLTIQQEKITAVNRELQQRHEDLLQAEDIAEMGSFFWDIKNDVSEVSPGVLKIYQQTETEAADSFLQYIHKDDKLIVMNALNEAYTKSGIYECSYRFVKNNIEKNIWTRGRVNFDAEGEPISMRGTILDVSRHHQLLNQLKESEALNKQSQAITHIGNWIWKVEENKVIWSDEMYRIYGLEPQSEEISIERFMSFVHPEDREQRKSDIESSLESGKVEDYILRIVSADGIQKILKGKGELKTDENNKPRMLVGSCQDITVEHTLNEELQKKEEYLSQLISFAPDCIVVFDEEGTINLWNPKAEEVFGFKHQEILGKRLSEMIFPKRHRKAYNKSLKELLINNKTVIYNKNIELTAINKAGEEFYISLTISQSIQSGKSFFIAFMRDISSQKQTKAELQHKTNQLKRVNLSLEYKNEELERMNHELNSFNYVASHDLQEPLRKIETFANRIIEKNEKGLPPATTVYLDKIIHSTGRMKLLIEDLLTFSQTTAAASKFQEVDLNSVLDEVKSILSTSIEEKTATIKSTNLPNVWGIPFQLQQLLVNLLSNSMKYCHSSKSPCITISADTIMGDLSGIEHAGSQTSYHRIIINDNGIGFENEHSEKIFGLFERLHGKDKFSGTGIGLAICKKILDNHNGFIKAESILGEGSVFSIFLPNSVAEERN